MRRVVRGDTLTLEDRDGRAAAEMTVRPGDGGTCTVLLKGSINNECAWDVGDELFALASAGKGLILDAGDLRYVSSAFADILVRLQIRMEQTEHGTMPIRSMPEEIFKSLKEQGCISSLDYELKEA